MKINQVNINDYTYTLPEEQIAKYPLEKRDKSKLLVYKKGQINEKIFNKITEEIPFNSLLIFNNTKVIRARLFFTKPTGAKIEIFCLEPHMPSNYEQAFNSKNTCIWMCLVGNLKKWKSNELIKKVNYRNGVLNLKATLLNNYKAYQDIKFSWDNEEITFGKIIELAGNIPIPPYLKREAEEIDIFRYQTVYSKNRGSVAAPTAGLHFTNEVLENIRKRKVKIKEITLHTGAGTFRPVKEKNILNHEMHTEFFSIHKDTLISIYNNQEYIINVGTTTLRAIESLYWLGIRAKNINNEDIPLISQWEPYSNLEKISPKQSIENLINFLENNNSDILNAKTQIIIMPGYSFKFTNGVITNFHLPKSTLLLLVAAFVGKDWKKIYDYALKNRFRLLSYGDSSILLK